MNTVTDPWCLLQANRFAAYKHRHQRRKDREAAPYINHPIDVAATLCEIGQVRDALTLAGALLHDTLEDTETTPEELEATFGMAVRHLVEEVTDDRQLPREDRKRLQISQAPAKSYRARLIKLADKICNVRDALESPPPIWSQQKKQQYIEHAGEVVAALRGTSPALEHVFDALYTRALEQFAPTYPLDGSRLRQHSARR